MDKALAAASEASAGAFVDALWLEEGLSRNTLDAYRRDLTLFGQWLATRGTALPEAVESDINAYFAERHAQTQREQDFFRQAPRGVAGLRQTEEQGEEHQQIEDQRQIHYNSKKTCANRDAGAIANR